MPAFTWNSCCCSNSCLLPSWQASPGLRQSSSLPSRELVTVQENKWIFDQCLRDSFPRPVRVKEPSGYRLLWTHSANPSVIVLAHARFEGRIPAHVSCLYKFGSASRNYCRVYLQTSKLFFDSYDSVTPLCIPDHQATLKSKLSNYGVKVIDDHSSSHYRWNELPHHAWS